MPLWKIAWRSIQRRSLASVLTMISMALGVMLVVAVLLIVGVIEDSFRSNSSLGYDAIVGPKGGKLQLTLNTVFYLSNPVENLPFHYYQEFLPAEKRTDRNAKAGEDFTPSLEQFLDNQWQTLTVMGEKSVESLSSGESGADSAADGARVDGRIDGSVGSTVLTIPAGTQELRIRVPILADEIEEGPEEFSLSIYYEDAYTKSVKKPLPLATGVCTIKSDAFTTTPTFKDKPVLPTEPIPGAPPSFHITSIEVDESNGYAELAVRLQQPAENDIRLVAEMHEGRDGQFYAFLEPTVPPVPVCLGDYYDHYRVVGTTADMFNLVFDPDLNRTYEFAEGGNFKGTGEFGVFEAILGAKVAREKGLKVGDTIQPTHGAPEGEGTMHEDQFQVVGILKMSGTPQDRAVFVHMDGFNSISDHIREDGMVEITAMLIDTQSVLHSLQMEGIINEGKDAQLVKPVRQIYSLFSTIVGRIRNVLLIITALICVVSGISILVSIYNSMSDRKQEIAVMRSLGAGRGTVMTIVLLESLIISLAGGLLGWIGGHALIGLASGKIERETGVVVSALDLAPPMKELGYLFGPELTPTISVEIWLIPFLIVLAIIVGIMPAMSAYWTDVAKALQSSP